MIEVSGVKRVMKCWRQPTKNPFATTNAVHAAQTVLALIHTGHAIVAAVPTSCLILTSNCDQSLLYPPYHSIAILA